MNGKAWYWMAVGVVALGLNSEYQRGGLQWAHRAVNRGSEFAVSAQVSGHRCLAIAKLMFGADPTPEMPSEVMMARIQEKVDCVQTKLARKRIQIENVERIENRIEPAMMHAQMALERAQAKISSEQMHAHRAVYLCPRTQKMTITVPEVSNARIPALKMHKMVFNVPAPEVDLSDVPGITGNDDTL
jgi:hypothetical protein